MEIIKHKILLESSIDRNDSSPTYGLITGTSFYINVFLTQNIDDMGMFTDIPFIPNLTINNAVLTEFGNVRFTGVSVSNYYKYGTTITAQTESRIEDVMSYNSTSPYRLNFDTNSEDYINYTGGTVTGVDRVTSTAVPLVYVFDADKNDSAIGTLNQKNGFVFTDETSATKISYIGEGWNATNTSLSGLIKEEYLFGITTKPEVKNDIFIDRGVTTVFEKHLKLSEIKTLNELRKYGNGYYNLTSN